MYLKFVFLVCLSVLILECVYAAPRNSKLDEDLTKSFVEFLEQDKELSDLLKRATLEGPPSLSRIARAIEDDNISTEVQPVDENKPGFFDRAAKFVMEVLQRFLKWINTENN